MWGSFEVVSRKKLVILLVFSAIIVVITPLLFGLYKTYTFDDFGLSPKAIQIESYNVNKAGSSYNVSLNICNSGRVEITLGKVFINRDESTKYEDWIEVAQYEDLTLSPLENATITCTLNESVINETGLTPHIRVESVDRILCQKQIDLLG